MTLIQSALVTHPDDTEYVRKNIDNMLQGINKEFHFQYRSRTKWAPEWQTLILTGIPSERNKKGNIIRYTGIAFNNTKWEKDDTGAKGNERQGRTLGPA